jgi:hypothetical protein
MPKYGLFKYGQCKYGIIPCPLTDVVSIRNISRQRISIFVEPDAISDIAPELDGYVGLNPGGTIVVEDDRINLGWLEGLRMLGTISLEFKSVLDPFGRLL